MLYKIFKLRRFSAKPVAVKFCQSIYADFSSEQTAGNKQRNNLFITIFYSKPKQCTALETLSKTLAGNRFQTTKMSWEIVSTTTWQSYFIVHLCLFSIWILRRLVTQMCLYGVGCCAGWFG